MEKIEDTKINEMKIQSLIKKKEENMIFPTLIKNTIQVKLFQNMSLIEKNLNIYQ